MTDFLSRIQRISTVFNDASITVKLANRRAEWSLEHQKPVEARYDTIELPVGEFYPLTASGNKIVEIKAARNTQVFEGATILQALDKAEADLLAPGAVFYDCAKYHIDDHEATLPDEMWEIQPGGGRQVVSYDQAKVLAFFKVRYPDIRQYTVDLRPF